jgi:GLPGLI family protein
MKKKIILAISIIFICCKIDAQPIDIMQLKCLYKYDYTYYTIRSEQKLIDTMMLEIGAKSCKFYSYPNYVIDSIRKTLPQGTWSEFKKTRNLFTVYVNYPENKTTFIDHARGGSGLCEYIEDFEVPKWTILNETKEILSHKCKKATCRFRGRDYVAWYATDIPISRGPYKFAGLPGLILKIADTENLYSFECVGMETSNKHMYKKDDYGTKPKQITRKEFLVMSKRAADNPQAALDQLVTELGALNPDEYKNYYPKGAKIKYNPIELE